MEQEKFDQMIANAQKEVQRRNDRRSVVWKVIFLIAIGWALNDMISNAGDTNTDEIPSCGRYCW